MGLFQSMGTNQGRAFKQHRARRNAHLRRDLTDFAEAIANGASLAEAGRVIGVSAKQASKHFARMQRELGWQADE